MITRSAKVALITLLLTFAGQALAAVRTLQVNLEGIADGDTLYVRSTEERATYRVRMAMIDAPEKAQEYGTQAKQALQQLLRGAGIVTLHVHGTDRYGRLIAIVEDERKRNINLEMVNQGAAWVYSQYAKRGEFAPYYSAITMAERNARMQRLGLWAGTDPIEPWRFRRSR